MLTAAAYVAGFDAVGKHLVAIPAGGHITLAGTRWAADGEYLGVALA